MDYKLRLLPKAEADYMSALEWYNSQSVETADRFLTELENAFEALENHPMFYSYYDKPYRRILLNSFPYKIIYEIDIDKVIVYAIHHTGQSDTLLRQRLP